MPRPRRLTCEPCLKYKTWFLIRMKNMMSKKKCQFHLEMMITFKKITSKSGQLVMTMTVILKSLKKRVPMKKMKRTFLKVSQQMIFCFLLCLHLINAEPETLWLRHHEEEIGILLESILRMVIRHTNVIVRNLQHTKQSSKKYQEFSYEEFLACIGITIRAASDRENFSSVDDIWSEENGKPFFVP